MNNTLLNTTQPQQGVKPSQFVFSLDRFPNASFLVQAVSIPSVNFGRAQFQTPVQDLNYPGDKLVYEDLNIEFVLDANLQNYIELYGWIRALAFTETRDDYAQFIQRRAKEIGASTKNRILEETTIATLTPLSSNGQPTFKFTFLDVFPVSLSSIDFNTTEDGEQFLKCTATFSYNYFNVERADSSTVSIADINNPTVSGKDFRIYG